MNVALRMLEAFTEINRNFVKTTEKIVLQFSLSDSLTHITEI